MSGAAVHLEPVRYAVTGMGLGCGNVRMEYHGEAVAYALDAPEFIARGSLCSRLHTVDRFNPAPYHYVSATEPRA